MLVSKHSTLIPPYGGELVDLTVPVEAFDGLKAYAKQLPSIQISPRSVCDLELLATGALSPLDRFMGREDYLRVLDEMRLDRGTIFPIPVTLPVEANPDLHLDQDFALRNNEYELMAIMTIDEIYVWDRSEFAEKVFGTQDVRHPLVAELHRCGSLNISGRLKILHLPSHFDFQDLRLTPTQTRARLATIEPRDVVAFQPSSKWHRANKGIFEKVLKYVDGILLLQFAVGLTKLGDVDHYTRISIYRTFVENYFEEDRIMLSLLSLASRMAGPREALWQALIHRNYGANQMIVSRDHASPPSLKEGKSFYNLYEAQDLVEKYSHELGVKIVPEQEYFENIPGETEGPPADTLSNIQAGRGYPDNGHALPGWYTRTGVAEILAEAYPPRHRQGVCIWFTGLSGAGKSTTAEILTWLLLEYGRLVTVLDGDVVRTHLSKGLGFSKDDRDTNVRRIGFVASELVRFGGVVICAVVSPYRAARDEVREMMGEDRFVEVFVNTPLEVCEARDVKGLYARARRGGLKRFTGIHDPYEPPLIPEITLDTIHHSPQENASLILAYLARKGFVQEKKTAD